MDEHQLEQVIVDFWEKRVDVLVCTTIVESGPRRLQREHPDHRAGRPARPLPAAPAARPGRAWSRAGLRLLPVPAGEAADRDRARPAGDDRAALRPRRRHGGRDEGPGDPRGGQPARRRAVRAHRRRRLRPLRAAGRRGGRGVPRRGRRRGARGQDRAAGRRPPAARLRARASGCGWRPTSGWPRSATDAEVDEIRAELRRPLRRAAARRSRTCWTWRGSGRAQAGRADRGHRAGPHIRFGPVDLPESGRLRVQRLYPKTVVKPAVRTILVPRPRRRGSAAAAARRGAAGLGRHVIDDVVEWRDGAGRDVRSGEAS